MVPPEGRYPFPIEQVMLADVGSETNPLSPGVLRTARKGYKSVNVRSSYHIAEKNVPQEWHKDPG